MSAVLELLEPKVKGFRCRLKGGNWDVIVPPGFKTSKGSYLRVNAAGKVTYSNPDCYIGDWGPGSRPFKMPAVRGRQSDSQTVFENLKDAINKRNELRQPCAGRPVGHGFHIVATDGHTALIAKGEGTGEHMNLIDELWDDTRVVAQITDPEFHLAIKRAALMSTDSKAIQLIGNRDVITVYSGDPEMGDFVGKVSAVIGTPFHFGINWKYLETVCGTWPLYLNYAGPLSAVMFYPESADWAYVVMPMRMK